MLKVSITGLDSLQKRLKQMTTSFEQARGSHEVSLGELFDPVFMSKYSRFTTIQELFDASGFTVSTQEDLSAIPDDEWDRHIRSSTSFLDWNAMQKAAGAEWLAKRMAV
ncbi:MAG: hypothetical protein RL318_2789 [Fibrobacterota bacterium]|jgi:hypothetical protein